MWHPEYSKVGRAGEYSLRVLIPKRVAEALKIKVNDEVIWTEENGKVRVEKVGAVENESFVSLMKKEVESHWDVFLAFKDAESIKAIP